MFEKVHLENESRFTQAPELSRAEVENALAKAVSLLKQNVNRFTGAFPSTVSGWYAETKPSGWSRNRYKAVPLPDWTSGLWTGLYWLIYELTGDTAFRAAAESQVEVFERVAKERIDLNDHDTGFKFIPSCIAAYRLTGDKEARAAALLAANVLLEHYCPTNHFIIRVGTRAPGSPYSFYRMLVDSMMNIPLFFWAYTETGEEKYLDAAVGHYNTTTKYLLRKDGSSYHHYQFDPETLEPVGGMTYQGNRDESCWSRGQSWLVYGYPIAYSYTKDESIIDIHRGVSYYFLNHLPSDFVPYWDFDFSDGSFEPRDSSASAIAACGLLEMSRRLPEKAKDRRLFLKAADCMLRALIERCTPNQEYCDGLLLHVTASKPHNMSIDGLAPYGDYFYVEALVRKLRPDWKMYW